MPAAKQVQISPKICLELIAVQGSVITPPCRKIF